MKGALECQCRPASFSFLKCSYQFFENFIPCILIILFPSRSSFQIFSTFLPTQLHVFSFSLPTFCPTHGVQFLLANYSWVLGMPWSGVFSRCFPLRKTDCPSSAGNQMPTSCQLEVEFHAYLPSSLLGFLLP